MRTAPSAALPGRKFIAGEPMKPATNSLAGPLVERIGVAHLLDPPVAEHDDAVRQRHGLDLVVGDVDRRAPHLLVQPFDDGAQAHAKLGIEVGEGLVEEEDAGVPHQRAADGDALALAARHLARAAAEQLGDLQPLGDLAHLAVHALAVDASESAG